MGLAGKHLELRDLPKEIRERLIKRQEEELADQFKIRNDSWHQPAFLGGAAGCWIWGLFALADDYRWTSGDINNYALVTALASVVLIWATQWLVRWYRSTLKCSIIVTPLYLIRTYMDHVSFWWLWDFTDIKFSQKFRFGTSSEYIVATVAFGEVRQTFPIPNTTAMRRFQSFIKTWASATDTAIRNRDMSYFISRDDFIQLRESGFTGRRPHTEKRSLFGSIVAGVLMAGALMLCANGYNEYCDDKKSWTAADAFGKAQSYRRYLATHSSGRWAASATLKIDHIYEQSTQAYVQSRQTGFEDAASEAVLDLLKYAKATHDYKVSVLFSRRNAIPDNVEQRLRHTFGVNNILPMGSAFSESRMATRENAIVKAMSKAFKEVIPEDVLDFVSEPVLGDRPRFMIDYTVQAGESLYYRRDDAGVARELRDFYPGITIEWQLRVIFPQLATGYNFSLLSQPAQSIQFRNSPGGEGEGIYDAMSESAFSDLGHEIIKRFGL
jgi:hypothetical protein